MIFLTLAFLLVFVLWMAYGTLVADVATFTYLKDRVELRNEYAKYLVSKFSLADLQNGLIFADIVMGVIAGLFLIYLVTVIMRKIRNPSEWGTVKSTIAFVFVLGFFLAAELTKGDFGFLYTYEPYFATGFAVLAAFYAAMIIISVVKVAKSGKEQINKTRAKRQNKKADKGSKTSRQEKQAAKRLKSSRGSSIKPKTKAKAIKPRGSP